MTQDLTIRLKTPHRFQKAFIESKARRICIRAGRRSGKTTGVAILAVLKFLEGHRVLYASKTMEQVGKFWHEVSAALDPLIQAGVYVKNETRHAIVPAKVTTESAIRAKTAWNADSLRGDFADVLILDEFQLMEANAWNEVGAPMMLDTDGTAVFIYTGKQGATHATALFKRAKQEMLAAKERGEQPRWEVFNFTSYDNPFISKVALSEISQDMSARAYELEILAVDDEDDSRALWNRQLLEQTRVNGAPVLTRIVVGVDPPGSPTNDCGIVVAGCGFVGDVLHGYVLEDLSLMGSPSQWAEQTIAAYHKHDADRVVAESNFGGDMVEQTIRTVEGKVPIKLVRASRGKVARADPIVSLYEKQKCHMVGEFPLLESELCRWHPTLFKSQPSPNRLDAMVWALSDLMLDYCATEIGQIELPMMV